jgi:hypothetical protein
MDDSKFSNPQQPNMNRSLGISKLFIRFTLRSAAMSYLLCLATYLCFMNLRFFSIGVMPILFVMYRVKSSGDALEEEIKNHGMI